jgi:predicted outer membrane protein
MIRNLAIATLLAGSALTVFSSETSPSGFGREVVRQSDYTRPNADALRTTDGYMAKWLSVAHLNQVELARVALKRSTDTEVQRFAQTMIDDHEELNRKLTRYVVAGNLPKAPTPDKPNSPDGNPSPQDRERLRSEGQSNGELDHSAFFEEMGAQCLSTARSELEAKRGAEFDHCYVTMVVGSHLMHNDMTLVFQRHVSPELKTVLSEAQTATKKHLGVAREFAQRLDRKASVAKKDEAPAKPVK